MINQLQGIEKQVGEKEHDITSLYQKIDELNEEVLLSKSIKESKEGKFQSLLKQATGEGEVTNNEEDFIKLKMKKIMNRRKMVDIARTQAEEIDYLRQELDRMRQRTFPSFVK
jgi:chromosome segregation ATPase